MVFDDFTLYHINDILCDVGGMVADALKVASRPVVLGNCSSVVCGERGFVAFPRRFFVGLGDASSLCKDAGVHPDFVRRLVYAERVGVVALSLVSRTKGVVHGCRLVHITGYVKHYFVYFYDQNRTC